MQCLTDPIFWLGVVESIFKNPHSTLLYCYFRHSLKSDQPVFQFIPAWQIENLWTHLSSRLWSLPKMNLSLLVIWALLKLPIICNGWCGSMNEGSKQPSDWDDSRHAPSWWFYLHCGIEVTGSPGIICIVCHQVLRHQSQHGTSSMGKHLLAKAYIAKWNELTAKEVTELTSLMVDETPWAIFKRQGSRGITTVSLHRKIRFDIQFDPYWLKWLTKRSQLADKCFETSEFHQYMWNRYLMLAFVSAHSPWNAISNLELLPSYMASVIDDLVLLSAATLSNIYRREYALTVNAIQNQLPSWNKVTLGLNRWTSTNKLAIMSGILYYTGRNWALGEVWIGCNEVERLFFCRFESYIWLIGQGPKSWSKASYTIEECTGLFRAPRQPFARYYDRNCFLKSLADTRAALNTWDVCNHVTCIEEPHTVQRARHRAGFRCIHGQSRCKRPHQVFGNQWAQSAMWRG